MLGQDLLLKKINDFTLDSAPRSIIITGDIGSEYLDVCDYFAKHLDLYNVDISEMISRDLVDQIYLNSTPTLYTIDLTKISDKDQNILLKLFEEPNKFTYIIMYGPSLYNVLETIITRSYLLPMQRYTREMLEPLVTCEEKEFVLDICKTPGQIQIANHTNIKSLINLCDLILTKMGSANYANALTISNKLNFKDEYDKFDLSLFINVLSIHLMNKNIPLQKIYKLYILIQKLNKRIWYINNKKKYFDNFLTEFWLEFNENRGA